MEEVESKAENKAKVDVYFLFKKLDDMAKDGVSEETLREAFEIFLKENQGIFRKPQKRILKTEDSVPMMSQADINKMYEDRLKRPSSREDIRNVMIANMQGIDLDESVRALETLLRNSASAVSLRKPSIFKIYAYRAAYYCVKSLVWLLCKIWPQRN